MNAGRRMAIVDGNILREQVERLRALSFKTGPYRPPSEGGSASLLLRITENCPWNRCTFCEMYKGHRFVYRPVEEIKADIVGRKPYRSWVTQYGVSLDELPDPLNVPQPDHPTIRQRQQAFGYTVEELKMVITPMIVTG